MSIPPAWLIHVITVEPYLGQTGEGAEIYGDPLVVPCFAEARTKRIRTQQLDSSTGDETLSTAAAYCDPRDDITTGSKVTLPPVLGGRTTKVLEVAPRDAGSVLPWSHLELILQ